VAVVGVIGITAAPAGAAERTYEMVSPVNKFGADVGVSPAGAASAAYSAASADGDRALFATNGTVGDAPRGLQYYATAVRTPGGWETRSAIPGPEDGIPGSVVGHNPTAGEFLSDDASALMFAVAAPYVRDNPDTPGEETSKGLYLARAGVSLGWLTRPLADSALPRPGEMGPNNDMYPVGGSEDFSTAYFAYCGTLTAADAPRTGRQNHGLYEVRGGRVATAGVLPDGSVDPDGAAPAGELYPTCEGSTAYVGSSTGNQVSGDGNQALFVSPDPASGSGRPPQLYAHRAGGQSVLLSRSAAGAPAPRGVRTLGPTGDVPTGRSVVQYASASRSGRYVVFASEDRLTPDAPAGDDRLYYRFDAESGRTEYLPGVTGTIHLVSDQGDLLYQDLDDVALWHAGARTVLVAGLTQAGSYITAPQVSADGRAWAFSSSQPIGAANHPDGVPEVYRYAVGDAAPTCLSCLPPGGNASTGATLDNFALDGPGYTVNSGKPRRPGRSLSADGRRLFFDTADPLVAEDTNGVRDVYTWEDGRVALISSGKNERNSYLLDASASGDDVFFATREGLIAGDRDGSYDVYDARVGGGFPPVIEGPVCTGDVCQAPSAVVPIVPVPESSLPGPGNIAPPRASSPVTVKVVSRVAGRRKAKVRVRVTGAGVLRATGAGIKAVRRSTSRAGVYTLTIRPAARQARLLDRRGSMRLRVRIAFVPAGSSKSTSKTVSVTVRK
jgi:hypothetical protein